MWPCQVPAPSTLASDNHLSYFMSQSDGSVLLADGGQDKVIPPEKVNWAFDSVKQGDCAFLGIKGQGLARLTVGPGLWGTWETS